MEEVARQTVRTRATDYEMSSLPKYVIGTATWLSILRRFENLFSFDVLLGGYIEHPNGDKTTVRGTSHYFGSVAVSSGYVMSSGAHYAEFQITGSPCIGIVRPMPGLDTGAYREGFDFTGLDLYPAFLAQRSDEWGDGDVHACDYSCDVGTMSWSDWGDEASLGVDWEGMEGCRVGDVVGMLLNLDEGTLTVYKNKRRLGVMKGGLSGPYCWYAELMRC